MLEDKIKEKIKTALIKKDEVSKDILRLTLGEIQREQNLAVNIDKPLDEDAKLTIVKKLIKSNETTLKELIKDQRNDSDKAKAVLQKEIYVLESLLGTFLSVDELIVFIDGNSIIQAMLGKANQGQLIGCIIKEAKASNLNVKTPTIVDAINKLLS